MVSVRCTPLEDEGLIDNEKKPLLQGLSESQPEKNKKIELINGEYYDRLIMVKSNGKFSQFVTSSLSMLSVTGEESPDVSLGYGYDEITGTWCGKCIAESELQAIDSAMETKVVITRIKDFSDLKQQLNFDAQATVSYGLFSSDMSYSRFASQNITKFAQYLLVQIEVKKSPELLKNVDFSEVGKDNINHSYKNFVRSCGTEFALGRVQGGKLYALVEVVSASEQDYISNSASLDASLGVWGSLQANFKNSLQSISQSSSLKTTIIQSGGKDEIITDIDQIVARINRFPVEVRKNPKTLYLHLSSYNGVNNYPRRFKREQIDWINDQYKTLATYLEKCYELRSDLIFVKTYPTAFPIAIKNQLDSLFKSNEIQINKYLDYATKLQNDFLTKKTLKPSDYMLPSPPNIIDLNFLPGWSLPKKPLMVRKISQRIDTKNRDGWECDDPNDCACTDGRWGFDRYTGSINVNDNQNVIINPHIECKGGACGWNHDHVEIPGTVWVSSDGKTLNWNFCASSASTTYEISADEVKYIIAQPIR